MAEKTKSDRFLKPVSFNCNNARDMELYNHAMDMMDNFGSYVKYLIRKDMEDFNRGSGDTGELAEGINRLAAALENCHLVPERAVTCVPEETEEKNQSNKPDEDQKKMINSLLGL